MCWLIDLCNRVIGALNEKKNGSDFLYDVERTDYATYWIQIDSSNVNENCPISDKTITFFMIMCITNVLLSDREDRKKTILC